jgi:hypothetical protein
MRRIDISGQKFGRLTALREIGPNKHGCIVWEFLCVCGNKTKAPSYSVRAGRPMSCGCLRLDMFREKVSTHRMTGTLVCNSWQTMMARCLNKNNTNFKNYGAIGILPCEFIRTGPESIIKTIGNREVKELTLERIDNSVGYFCGSCDECRSLGRKINIKWATRKEQLRNTRRTRNFTIGEKTQCATDWGKEFGIKSDTFIRRFNRGLISRMERCE